MWIVARDALYLTTTPARKDWVSINLDCSTSFPFNGGCRIRRTIAKVAFDGSSSQLI